MIAVFGHDQTVAQWAGQRMDETFHPPFTAIGFSKDGQTLHGAAIFNGWNRSNIDITICGPGCLSRYSIGTAYQYVFCQLNAARLTARTARRNKRMQKLLPRLGFKFESVAQRYYGTTRELDGLVYRLLPEDALAWLPSMKLAA